MACQTHCESHAKSNCKMGVENLVDIIHYNGKEMVDTRHTVAEIAGQPPQPISNGKQQHGNGTYR